MSSEKQTCPICQKAVQPSERYPRYLCTDCAARAKSKDGRSLKFSNIDMSCGYAAHYADTGESHPSHECYVDGIQCYADENQFGRIVIQIVLLSLRAKVAKQFPH